MSESVEIDEPGVKIEYVYRKGVGWCPEQMYLHNGKWLTLNEALDWLQEDMSKTVFAYLRNDVITPEEVRINRFWVDGVVVV